MLPRIASKNEIKFTMGYAKVGGAFTVAKKEEHSSSFKLFVNCTFGHEFTIHD